MLFAFEHGKIVYKLFTKDKHDWGDKMIFSILLGFILAKFHKYKILPIFKTYLLYPLFAVELIFYVFQVSVFMGNYSFIPFAPYLKYAYMLVMFLPIIAYKLYSPALVGSGFIVAGTLLNNFVISSNAGKMPVYPTLSLLTGYFKPDSMGKDSIHVLLNESTKYKMLTDVIDIGWSILSIGDVLIHSFIAIIVYYTIKEMNRRIIVRC